MSASAATASATPSLSLRQLVGPGLFLLALTIRVFIIMAAHFDGLYGQDAFAYLDYTKQILNLHLTGPFYWPLGYPLVAALFGLLLRNPVMGAQAASVILSSALAPLTYMITFELLAPATDNAHGQPARVAVGLIAGLLTATSGQLLQSSIVIMSDAAGVLWATLAAVSLIKLGRSPRTHWVVLAGITLAMAIISRWIYVALILPFGLYFLAKHRSLLSTSKFLISSLIFLVIVISQFAFSQTSAAPVLSHGWVVNWSPINAFRNVFDNPDGHFIYHWPPLIFYADPMFHPLYLFPLLSPFVFIGAWQVRKSLVLLLLGGWILTLYPYLIGIPYENIRFGLSFFPPIVILAAVGLAAIPPLFSRLLWPIFLVSMVASLPYTRQDLVSLLALKANELAAAQYLQRSVGGKATVITFGLTPTLEHYSDFGVVELYDQSPRGLHDLICPANASVYVFVEADNINTQWAGKAPQINFLWLQEHAGLVEIGRQTSWTLYKVSPNCSEAAP
jgi:hypothetical protein